MRRKQCEITDPEKILQILRRCTVGRLATSGRDGYPYITPVNYVYHNDSVYFHCAHQGEKIDNIFADNRVCFEVDIPLAYLDLAFDPSRPPCQVHQFYHCVIIRGRAEIVEDLVEKVPALNALMASHERRPDFAAITSETPAVALCTVVAVRIDNMSCKSDLAQKKTDEERRRISVYLHNRNFPGDDEASCLLGEKALKESEEKYRLLSENATDVIWTLDLATGRFTYFSPSVQIMRGYTPEEALEIPLEKTLLPESYQRAVTQIKESLGREELQGITPNRLRLMEFEEYCKDGSTIHTEAKVKFTRDKNGRPTGVIGISRDITERKRSEAERERLIVELQTALGYVKRLSGLLPICASCKKIRDDGGYWHDVAAYIHDHSEADFSHGICPDCMAKLYPEYSG
jgi:uncharacterized protein